MRTIRCSICKRQETCDGSLNHLAFLGWELGDGWDDLYCPDHAHVIVDQAVLDVLDTVGAIESHFIVMKFIEESKNLSVNVTKDVVRKSLQRLLQDGFVDHRRGQWRISDERSESK